jgi:hypothetical protein
MKHGVLALFGLVAGTGLALGVGCSGESKLDVVIEEGASAPRVQLPSVPTLPPSPYPVTYAPGIYSVYGARHQAARNWNKEIRVRGYIAKVYTPIVPGSRPPRVCTERDHCNEEKPHIFIADTPNEQDPERLMMVTGYASFQSDIDAARLAARRGGANPAAGNPALAAAGLTRPVPVDFYEGAQITVTGILKRRADNGHADSNGLLDYRSHETNQPSPQAPQTRH